MLLFLLLLFFSVTQVCGTCETPGQAHLFAGGVQSGSCAGADLCDVEELANQAAAQAGALEVQMDALEAEMDAFEATEIIKYSSSFVQGTAGGFSPASVNFGGSGSAQVFPAWHNATAQEQPTLGLDAGGTNITAPATGVYQLSFTGTFRNAATYDNSSDYNVYLFFGITLASSSPPVETELPFLQFYLNQGHDPTLQSDVTVSSNFLYPLAVGDHFRLWWKQATGGDYPLRQVNVQSAMLGVRFVR